MFLTSLPGLLRPGSRYSVLLYFAPTRLHSQICLSNHRSCTTICAFKLTQFSHWSWNLLLILIPLIISSSFYWDFRTIPTWYWSRNSNTVILIMELICCSSPPEFDRVVFNHWLLAFSHLLIRSCTRSINQQVTPDLLTYLVTYSIAHSSVYSFNQSLVRLCIYLIPFTYFCCTGVKAKMLK